MSRIIPNSFTSYELTEKEELQGSIFNTSQLEVLQNTQANVATEKLNLELDPEHPTDFIQQEAYKKGQLDLITNMIDKSIVSAEELANPTPE